jgi:hypothetical protein
MSIDPPDQETALPQLCAECREACFESGLVREKVCQQLGRSLCYSCFWKIIPIRKIKEIKCLPGGAWDNDIQLIEYAFAWSYWLVDR